MSLKTSIEYTLWSVLRTTLKYRRSIELKPVYYAGVPEVVELGPEFV